MKAGRIVLVDWRDALPGSGEPNKRRPAVVVGAPRFFENRQFEMLVPLTTEASLAIVDASLRIEPTPENRCTKPCYALAWNLQTVPLRRILETAARVTDEQLTTIRRQIAACVDADAA